MLRRSIFWLAVCLLICQAHSAHAAGDALVARQSNPQLPTFTVFSGVPPGSTASETRAGLSTRTAGTTSTTVTRTEMPAPSSTTVDAGSSSASSSATSMSSSSSTSMAPASTTSSRPDGAAATQLTLWPALLLSVSLAALNVL